MDTINMTTITLEGKEYQLDIERAKILNLLKEKDSRVRSWEECVTKYRSDIVYGLSDVLGLEKFPGGISSTRTQFTHHEAKALAALSKLLKLRRDWIGEWKPDWEDNSPKYIIQIWKNRIYFEVMRNTNAVLSFPTEQIAKEFLETFRDLIEEAKILI